MSQCLRCGAGIPVWVVTAATAFAVVTASAAPAGLALPDPSHDGGAGTLEAVASMLHARAAHTATTLRDGRVLVAGGMSQGEGGAAAAELYDPGRGTFLPTGAMTVARQSHTATRLPDGDVLIAGGLGARGEYLDSVERYDAGTGTFHPAGRMVVARSGHAAVTLSNRRILIVGGTGVGWSFLASAEIFDPATGRSVLTGSMRMPRESHTATLLADGRVLITGGHRGRHADIQIHSSAEVYDPATGRFRDAGAMSVRRHKHDAVRLRDGRVLVTGGADERDDRGSYRSAEIWDPARNTFRSISDMRLAHFKHRGTSVLLANGRVLVAAGASRAEVYDADTQRFSLVGGSGRMGGAFSAVAALEDGRVLVTGGYGQGRGARADAWIYTP